MLTNRKSPRFAGIATLKQRDRAVRELRRADLALRAAIIALQDIGLNALVLHQGHAIDLAEIEFTIGNTPERGAANEPP